MRSSSDSLNGRMNPHLSAAMKLTTTSLTQEFSETAMEVLGCSGTSWRSAFSACRAIAASRSLIP